jgi:hypothetical protein
MQLEFLKDGEVLTETEKISRANSLNYGYFFMERSLDYGYLKDNRTLTLNEKSYYLISIFLAFVASMNAQTITAGLNGAQLRNAD